jgi:peptide/nickel transport system substrate-binding protein
MDSSYLNSETAFLRIGGEWEPPLNDRRVRLALNYAINRDAIRGTILSKDVIPAAQIVPPNIPGYNTTLKPWPYDPQKAKQLLDEARKDGVPVDVEIPIILGTGSFPGDTEIAEAMASMYRAVGLNIKAKQLEAGLWRPYTVKPFPKIGPYLLASTHDNNKGDPIFTVPTKYHCDGSQSHLCDKILDDLIDKASVAPMGQERKNLWAAAFKRLHEEIVPDVILFHTVSYARVGKRINFKPSPALASELQLRAITFK